MTRKQQTAFIRDLSRNIEKELIGKIKRIPETKSWDGHELRMLLAERHASAGRMSCIKDEPRSRRAMDYRNLVTIHNL